MKLESITSATVVDDAVRFVSDRSKEKSPSSNSSNEDDKEESSEPDHDEKASEINDTPMTTNEVF
jgi:hypothetical protein